LPMGQRKTLLDQTLNPQGKRNPNKHYFLRIK